MPSLNLPRVNLIRLGRLGYAKAYQIQQQFQSKALEGSADMDHQHTMLVVEHDPVYTLGLREKISPKERGRLEGTGAEIVETNRGGLTTFHGPGQLVVYPILNLEKFHKMTLKSYVAALETVAVHACRMLGVPAVLNTESVSHTGAWANGNKICAVGVHCKRHVTTHGLALNCNVDLSWFKNIVPCGIHDKGVTSLTAELGQDCSIHDALGQFVYSFESTFKCKIEDCSKDYQQQVHIL